MKKDCFSKLSVIVFCFILVFSFSPALAQQEESAERPTYYDFVSEGRDIIVGVNFGGMFPMGKNIKSNYNVGVPVSICATLPAIAKIGKANLDAGVETGVYYVWREVGNIKLTGIPILIFAGLDFPQFVGKNTSLGIEIAAGIQMQFEGEDIFLANPTYEAVYSLAPGISFGYKVSDKVKISAKLRATEIGGPNQYISGLQEWIDFRVGVDYTLKGLLRERIVRVKQ